MNDDLSADQGLAERFPASGEAVGVLSPHMDDAALSCGDLLGSRPGSHVVTVFSGGPEHVKALPEWDEMSGMFRPGDNIMGMRAVEDQEAMTAVGAVGHRLGFWDEQYRAGPPVRHARYRPLAVRVRQARLDRPTLLREIDQALARVIDDIPVRTWFIPLGLWHGDHKKTARAGLRQAARRPDLNWFVYEELPYRHEVPDQVTEGRRCLQADGYDPQELIAPGPSGTPLKRAMVACYRSQLTCLGARAERAVTGPEVFLLLALAPSGAPVAGRSRA